MAKATNARYIARFFLSTYMINFGLDRTNCFQLDNISPYNPFQFIYVEGGTSTADNTTTNVLATAYGDGPRISFSRDINNIENVGYAMFDGNSLYSVLSYYEPNPDYGQPERSYNLFQVYFNDPTSVSQIQIDFPFVEFSQCAGLNVGNKYFALFGGGESNRLIYVYDINLNQWSISAYVLPTPSVGGSVQIVNNMIYYVGNKFINVARAVNTAISSYITNTWEEWQKIENEEREHGTHFYGRRRKRNRTEAWTTMPPLNYGRAYFALLVNKNWSAKELIAIGGVNFDSLSGYDLLLAHYTGTVEIYDVNANVWVYASGVLNIPRAFHGAVWIPDTQEILVCGGRTQSHLDAITDTCEILDMCTDNPSWSLLPNFRLYSPLANFAMVVIDNTPTSVLRGVPCQTSVMPPTIDQTNSSTTNSFYVITAAAPDSNTDTDSNSNLDDDSNPNSNSDAVSDADLDTD